MNWLKRAVAGALVGALAVLFIHPEVRPIMLHGLMRYQPSAFARTLLQEQTGTRTLPNPKAGTDNADLLEAGADQVVSRRGLTQNQALLMAEIALAGKESEPENAYWLQMSAVFQQVLAHPEESAESWQAAAELTRWNDYAPARAARKIEGLEEETGENLAWHRAVAWETQKGSSLSALESITWTMSRTEPGATAANARLIINNIAPGRRRTQLRLGVLGGAETKRLVAEDQEPFSPVLACFTSMLTASLPGAFLLTSAFGFLLWFLARLGAKTEALRWLFSPVYSAPIGTVLGFLLYLVTRQPFAAFSVALAFAAFALVQPNRDIPKGSRPNVAGLVAVARSAGIAGALALTLLLAGLTQSSQAVLQLRPDVALAPVGSPLLAAGSIFCLAIAIAAAPAWAHFKRWPAWEAGALALRQFGFAMAVLGAVGAVAAAPACLALDRVASNALDYHLFEASN